MDIGTEVNRTQSKTSKNGVTTLQTVVTYELEYKEEDHQEALKSRLAVLDVTIQGAQDTLLDAQKERDTLLKEIA